MQIDRRYLTNFDYISFFLTLMISCVGLAFVFSATYTPENTFSLFFKKQFFGVISGIFIYFICCYFDYRALEREGYLLYFLTILLLIFTAIKGTIGLGAKRWINLFFIKFQPSELAKFFFPAFFSYYLFSNDTENLSTLKFNQLLPVIVVLLISVLLILKQPDLGTALIMLFSGGILLWLAGLNRKYFIMTFIVTLISAPILYKSLKPYQRKRIEVFMGAGDSKKERYQLEQSLIAVGSGGLLGKGYLKGTQNKLLFLPESRTDFIFAVLCEEWGFVGALFLILLYALLFIRFFYVISTINNFFAQLFASGLVIHIILSTIINISMVLGLMPIVGIPLPLMSYGVTNLWITFASLGALNSIVMRRFYFNTLR